MRVTIIAVLVIAIAAWQYHASIAKKLTATELVLRTEKAKTVGFEIALSATTQNSEQNEIATQRQMENEQKIRSDADEKKRVIHAAAQNDECANRDMPADIFNSLR